MNFLIEIKYFFKLKIINEMLFEILDNNLYSKKFLYIKNI